MIFIDDHVTCSKPSRFVDLCQIPTGRCELALRQKTQTRCHQALHQSLLSIQTDDWINSLLRLAGSKERLLILSFLGKQKQGVHAATISTETGVKQTTFSWMLRELEDLGYIHGDLAQAERRGRAVRYRIQPSRIRGVLRDAGAGMGVKL